MRNLAIIKKTYEAVFLELRGYKDPVIVANPAGIANVAVTVATIPDLLALDPLALNTGTIRQPLGYANALDCSMPPFALRAGTPAEDNQVTIYDAGNGLVWEAQYSGPIDAKWAGVKADGVTDDTAALNRAMAIPGTVLLPEGTIFVSDLITANPATSLIGRGMDITIIDGSSAVPSIFNGGLATHIGIGGENYQANPLPALAADINQGSQSITFASAHGLVEGDTILAENSVDFSLGVRSFYRRGQLFTVHEVVSGTEIKTVEVNKEFLSIADNAFYKGGHPGSLYKGFTLRCRDTAEVIIGMYFQAVVGAKVESVKMFAPAHTGILFDKGSYRCNVEDSIIVGAKNVVAAAYGVLFSNSSGGVISNNQITASRHAVDAGGDSLFPTIPCYDISVSDNTLSSTGGVGAASCHGNCADWSFTNNKIFGGMILRGGRHIVCGNHIYAPGDQVGLGIIIDEIYDPNLTITSNQFYSFGNQPERGFFIDWGGNSNSIVDNLNRSGTVIISDNCFNLKINALNLPGIKIVNRGALQVQVNVVLHNNQFFSFSGSKIAALQIQRVSGDAIFKADVRGNRCIGFAICDLRDISSADVQNNTSIDGAGTILYLHAESVSACGNQIVNASAQAITIQGSGILKAIRNQIDGYHLSADSGGASTRGAISFIATVAGAKIFCVDNIASNQGDFSASNQSWSVFSPDTSDTVYWVNNIDLDAGFFRTYGLTIRGPELYNARLIDGFAASATRRVLSADGAGLKLDGTLV